MAFGAGAVGQSGGDRVKAGAGDGGPEWRAATSEELCEEGGQAAGRWRAGTELGSRMWLICPTRSLSMSSGRRRLVMGSCARRSRRLARSGQALARGAEPQVKADVAPTRRAGQVGVRGVLKVEREQAAT